MSSSSGLNRTRSLRRPAELDSQSSQRSHHQQPPSSSHQNGGQNTSSSPSRLPVKPTASSTTTTRPRAPTTGMTRPATGLFSGKANSSASTKRSDEVSKPPSRTLSTRRAGQPSPTMPPPSSSLASTSHSGATSSGRPRTSGGVPAASTSSAAAPRPRPAGHARVKSTATTLTPATTLRPLGCGQSQHSSAATTSTSSSTANTSRLQTRSHARTQSASSRATATSSSTNAAAPAPAAAASRPAFNTNQKHYSPLKSHAPKPLTSTFLAPPSPSKLPSNVALSAETSRLQTELLQLALLHRDAHTVADEWHASARDKLGRRFESLAARHRDLADGERAAAESRNVAALERWGGSPSRDSRHHLPLEEKIQVLDQVLGGLWALGGSTGEGGRFGRSVRGFEAWANRAATILAAQRSGAAEHLIGADDEVVFLGELDDGWKAESAALTRKLKGWRAALDELGEVPPAPGTGTGAASTSPPSAAAATGDDGGSPAASNGSGITSIERILQSAASLIDGMLAELGVMEQIQRDAAAAETAWVERANRELLAAAEEEEREQELAKTPGGRNRARKKRTEETQLWKMVVSSSSSS